jgi:ribosomal protein S18 acetylase RimI-like enzyme
MTGEPPRANARIPAVDPLDNPVWHALTGPQQTVAQATSLAARYDPAFAPFAALPDAPSPDAWFELRALVGPTGLAVLFAATPAVPRGWSELFRMPTRLMVATAVEPAIAPDAELLNTTDLDQVTALVDATQPGPFAERTIELGTYLGVRDHGTLVAMAGERMHLPGYTEISAVCTAASHRGRGLAALLVGDLVRRIRAHDETPILHVLETNESAIRLYEAMGFTTRRVFDVVGLRPTSVVDSPHK